MKASLVAGAVLLLCPAPLPAQARTDGLGAVVMFVRQGSSVENASQSGTWAGLEGRLATGRATIVVRMLRGSLGGHPLRLDRNARETDLTLRLWLKPWLAVGADAVALRLDSELAHSVWRMYGIVLTGTTDLGITGMRAAADLSVFPFGSTVASDGLALPTRGEVALMYRLPRLPLELVLAYRMQAVNFDAAADLRFGGIALSLMFAR